MRPKRKWYCLAGGPFAERWVLLTSPSTMVMNSGEWHGRYVRGNGDDSLIWEDMK